jgi:hypothetical protein
MVLAAVRRRNLPADPGVEAGQLNVLTHDAFAVSAKVMRSLRVKTSEGKLWSKAGTLARPLNRLLLTCMSGTLDADVFFAG